MIRIICVAAIAALACAGCANIDTVETEYYESGKVKSVRTHRDTGWAPGWSDGAGKNLPLSHLTVSGIGGSAGGVVSGK